MDESLDITNIKTNFTKMEDAIYDFVESGDIKVQDAVVFVAIKTQVAGRYGTSNGSICRVFNLKKSTVTDSIGRLLDANLIDVEYTNGTMTCSTKKINDDVVDKIPKSLIMTNVLDIKQKSFMLAIWGHIEGNSLPFSRSGLHNDIFKFYGMGKRWVNSRINELIDIGILSKHIQKIGIDLSKIIEISDMVIDGVLIDSSKLEDTVVEYETKTGVARENIFNWTSIEDVPKKDFNSPKWMSVVVDAIDKGCESLNKNPFDFNSSDFINIGSNIKAIVSARDGDSEERVMKRIADSILWKANNASRNEKELKYWTKGFFSRKIKNNIASNLYHYDRDMEANPYAKKPTANPKPKKVAKKKEPTGFNEFDYGIDI
tara:strand:- start:312 stop:1430 length:1119 start_codon:yes stop_codon:yes gene_type:complete